MPLTFQILDSLAQDLQVEAETETTCEVSYVDEVFEPEDGEVVDRTRRKARPATKSSKGNTFVKPRKMIIHLFGTTAEGKSIRVNVEGFEPFFFVKMPSDSRQMRKMMTDRVEELMPGATVTFEKRKVLFGYTNDALFPFAKLSVDSLSAFRSLKNNFLDKEGRSIFSLVETLPPLEVFEANLDPMLRFFHLRNLQPCGWVTVEGDIEETGREIVGSASWEDVTFCAKPPAASANFLLASWDIECYSENGEFPVPRRDYTRVAKLILANAEDAGSAMGLLTQAALEPDRPPEGMDALRTRSGRPVDRGTLELLFGADSTFSRELPALLEGRESLTGAAKEERVKALTALFKRTLEKAIPLAGDPVIQIGVVLQRGQAGPLERHIFVYGSCEAVEGATVYSHKSEKEMILGWATKMCVWNPDILLGYNTFGFDERYLWIRAEELGLTEMTAIQSLTRLANSGKRMALEEKFLSSSALGDNTMYIWSTHGRLQIDLYHYVKRSFALGSYKLDDVCLHFMSGKLSKVECQKDLWTLKTKTTADVAVGRYVVLLDETGDRLVDKLRVVEVRKGEAVVVEAPQGDDADDLAIAAATALKWAIVKDDVSPQEIFKFHRGSAADRAKVAAYCVQDCILVLDLYKKLEVFNNAMAMANACSVPIGYIFTRGQGIKIESLIFKECYERQQCIAVLPAPPQRDGQVTQDESYEGAIVLDPIPGFYFDSPIGVADFASLYPSTIISENISYDTLVSVKDYNMNGSFREYSFGSDECEKVAGPGVRYTDISFDIWGSDPADKRKHPAKIKTGVRICRYAQLPGNRKGSLPDIVDKLLKARKAKRKEAEKESDPFRKALLDAEQLAYKLTANSLYGQLGSGTFKIRLQHLAASVTAYGRKQILFAKAAIERFYGPAAADPRCSAEITYGDTDSLFVNFNVKNPETGELLKGEEALKATMELTEEAGKFVTRCLKPPHDFEYDKVFSPFIIFSKKRYVGNKYEESVDYYSQTSMGIATKRRDYAALVKVIYGGALRILLTDRDIVAAVTFVKEKLKELVEGKMSLNLLTMSKSLRAEYSTPSPPAHKVLAERIKARDPGNAPASGERVPFIYVLPPLGQPAAKLQGDRVETPGWIRAKGLKPDVKFYIEHQLMNPITQLFALVADKIPGVVPPSGGWANAAPGYRESATVDAIFDESFKLCDKIATRAFATKMFGLTGTNMPVPTERRTSPRTVAAVATQKVQPKLSFFMDKIIMNKSQACTKSKRSAQAKKAGES